MNFNKNNFLKCHSISLSEFLFYLVSSFLVLGILVSILLNCDLNWMNLEVYNRMIPVVLKESNHFQWKDLLRTFDAWTFDDRPRFRWVSYLFQIINIKSRIWLFHYIPPHASLSLTWIFTFILSPIFLFKLTYRLTSQQIIAWICVLLYLLSPGQISLGVVLFHPGKPLSQFFFILCFYIALKLHRSLKENKSFSKKETQSYYFLLVLLFFSFLTDEVCWFLFPAIPLFFPRIFLTPKKGIPTFLSYCLPVMILLVLVTFVAPPLVERLGFRSFDFWNYLDPEQMVKSYGLKDVADLFFLNCYYLLSTHMVPFYEGYAKTFFPSLKIAIYAYSFWFTYFGYLYFRLPKPQKKLAVRVFLAFIAFILFHTVLMLKHSVIFQQCWYYGTVASIFIAIICSLLLSFNHRPFHILNKIAMILLCIIFVTNFTRIHRKQILLHNLNYVKSNSPVAKQMVFDKKLSYAMILEAWHHRKDPNVLAKLQKYFPLKAHWLFVELEYLARD